MNSTPVTLTTANWMQAPSLQDKMLHQLTIPGSHDSGTYSLPYSGTADKASKTQTLGFAQQLELGIRFFDIRVNTDGMTINHGKVNTGVTIISMLETFKAFLKVSNETIVMHVKHEWGPTQHFHREMVNTLNQVFNGSSKAPGSDWERHIYMHPMHLDGHIPTLTELRGKLVYVRRYGPGKEDFIDPKEQDGSRSGIPVDQFATGTQYKYWSDNVAGQQTWQQYYDTLGLKTWPDNEGNFDEAAIDLRNRDGLSFVIQDWYSINFNGGTYDSQSAAKIEVVTNYLNSAAGITPPTPPSNFFLSPDSWYLNFVSVCELAYPPMDWAVGTGRCNERLQAVVSQLPRERRYGTIILNFCESPSGLVNDIINLNFPVGAEILPAAVPVIAA